MLTSAFGYELPEELIAQAPAVRREESRLMVLDRGLRSIRHMRFGDFPVLLREGDVLVLNDSRVIPARLRGRKVGTGGEIEVLLVEESGDGEWWVMLRPGKRVRVGRQIAFRDRVGVEAGFEAEVTGKSGEGEYRLRFNREVMGELPRFGEVPLPPYIRRRAMSGGVDDESRYQTVYAREPGSVAAPTAGLHFSEGILERVEAAGVVVRHVTLHVGLGTFAPVKSKEVEGHIMHAERYRIGLEAAEAIRDAKKKGRRVIAVGTTTVRVLESVAGAHGGEIKAGEGRTRLFIYPPYQFRAVDGLLTNFHLPESTLLMLVCAFGGGGGEGGREFVLRGYREAVRLGYQFFSYGDAMYLV